MNKNISPFARWSRAAGLILMVALANSCNKKIPQATPIVYPPVNNSTTTIGAAIASDTSYSFFATAAARVGAMALLSDSSKVFTVFVPDNNAFRISGIPSVDVINALPLATVGAIVDYHIIPGEQFLSGNLGTTFPNIQLPSYLSIGTLPGTPISLNLTTFLSIRTGGFWDNNIPVTLPDQKFENGVIHQVGAVVNPPSQLLKQALYSNPNLTYFKAAVARADSGQVGLNRIDSLLGYAVTNMTVLAPDDNAFRTLIFGLAFQAYLSQVPKPYTHNDTLNATGFGNNAVAAGPAFLSTSYVTSGQVQGILAYHLLATPNPVSGAYQPNIRAFSVNFPATPTLYTTMVNSVYPTHPGVMAQATFAGPIVTNLQFTGLGTFPSGGAPFSGPPAVATSLDNHCVNGVFYIINQVLLPQ
ncbi:MAG: fasciclin domain-containing protein [Bacteroidota bacterium]|nr:fasciclin domain-containing protein [Bacteroidota bacterium]